MRVPKAKQTRKLKSETRKPKAEIRKPKRETKKVQVLGEWYRQFFACAYQRQDTETGAISDCSHHTEQKSNLRTHHRQHTGEAIFCPEPECRFECLDPARFTRHKQGGHLPKQESSAPRKTKSVALPTKSARGLAVMDGGSLVLLKPVSPSPTSHAGSPQEFYAIQHRDTGILPIPPSYLECSARKPLDNELVYYTAPSEQPNEYYPDPSFGDVPPPYPYPQPLTSSEPGPLSHTSNAPHHYNASHREYNGHSIQYGSIPQEGYHFNLRIPSATGQGRLAYPRVVHTPQPSCYPPSYYPDSPPLYELPPAQRSYPGRGRSSFALNTSLTSYNPYNQSTTQPSNPPFNYPYNHI